MSALFSAISAGASYRSAQLARRSVELADRSARDSREQMAQSKIDAIRPTLNFDRAFAASATHDGKIHFRPGGLSNIGHGPAIHVKARFVIGEEVIKPTNFYFGTLNVGEAIAWYDLNLNVEFDDPLMDVEDCPVAEVAVQLYYQDIDQREYVAVHPYWIFLESNDGQPRYTISIMPHSVSLNEQVVD